MKKFAYLFVIGLVGVVLNACGSSEPKDIAVSFIKDMASGNGESLISYFDVPKEQGAKEILDGKLKMAADNEAKNAKSKGGIDKIEVLNENITEDKAFVEITITYKDGTQERDSVRFKKVDGNWKIAI